MKHQSQKIISGIQDYFYSAGKKNAVIGMSGGVDSSLTAVLTAKALGGKNVFALIMPEHGLTSPINIRDAAELAKKYKMNMAIIPINKFLSPFSHLGWKQSKLAKANLRARIRAVLLYNFANSNDSLVVGTSNKTERLLGYFTKYGDGAVDIEPIGNLYKCEVRAMARILGIPNKIVDKMPTAELFRGQTDELELGMSYNDADTILMQLEKGESLSTKKAAKIKRIIKANEHKSSMPPVIEL